MRISLKLKLAAVSAIGMLVVASGGSWMLWHAVADSDRETIDALLRLPGRRLTERTGWDTRWDRFDRSLRLVFGEARHDDLIIRVVGHGPRYPVYYESENWPEDIRIIHPENAEVPAKPSDDDLYPVRNPFLYTVRTFDKSVWRMANLANSDLTLHIGHRMDNLLIGQSKLAGRLAIASITVAALIFAFTWWVGRRALRPVESIAATAQALTARDLSRRVPLSGDVDAEFQSLTLVINEMIDRLERSFRQASRFSADASHELRTPITNLYAEVSRLLNRADSNTEEHRALGSMLDELERLRSVLSGLLLLSKAESGRLDHGRDRVDFSEQLRRLCEDYELLAVEEGLTFVSDIAPDMFVNGDATLLNQAAHNLLRNAMQHNRPGGTASLSAIREGELLITRVTNTGPPIVGEWRERVFKRFGKAPHTKEHGGYGIGLNIVVEILRAHGGEIRLEASDKELTVFAMILPAT